MELRGDLAVMRMDGAGQAAQARQEAIVGEGGLIGLDRAHRPGHAHHAGDDQRRAAFGLLLMIVDEPVTAAPVLFRKANAHCGDEHAVLELHRTDATGSQQVPVSAGGGTDPVH
jgi:hypothetical protein